MAARRALSRIRPRASISGSGWELQPQLLRHQPLLQRGQGRGLCSAPASVAEEALGSAAGPDRSSRRSPPPEGSASGTGSGPSRRLEELKSGLRTGTVPSLQAFLQTSPPAEAGAAAVLQSVVVTRHHHQQQQQQQQRRSGSGAAAAAAASVEEEEEDDEADTASGAGRQSPQPAAASPPSPLTDSFGRRHTYLRISLTERCNLRCTYCMPADGVPLQAPERLLQSDEILELARVFVSLGVTKIRLTGGEPLIRKDVVELTRSLKALPGLTELAVTTNAVSPWAKLEALVGAGMTHFNVSLDTLQADKFARISRRPGKYLETVLGNVERLLRGKGEGGEGGEGGGAGLGGRVKLNCVVMRGVNDDELGDFVALTRDRALDVRLIEWMPFDSNGWNGGTFVAYSEMIERLRGRYPAFARDTDGPNDTTKWYRVPGHRGRVGFITSMSQHFCGDCNRLRVTADGKLKVCLFGAEDLSLRDALRAGTRGEALVGLIGRAVRGKKFSLGGQQDMYELARRKNRPMILIGG